MKKGRKMATCQHCGKKTSIDTNYCHHCGKRMRGHDVAAHTCPSCRRAIHTGDMFCKHCGLHFSTHKRQHHTSFLVKIILFLVLFLALFLLFMYPRNTESVPPVIEQEKAVVSLSQLSCKDVGQGFTVCGDITWEGGSYAKAHIPGGEELAVAEKQYTSFRYCQDVGYDEGFRVFRGFVYDVHGTVVAEQGEGLSCTRIPQHTTIVPQPEPYEYETTVNFYSQPYLQRPVHTGIVTVDFPDPILSCAVAGTYVIEDGGEKTGTKASKIKQYCDDAAGSFAGVVNYLQQSVITDPDYFEWDSQTFFDPAPTLHEGYFVYAYTCDTQFYAKHRYFTSVIASGLGTDQLTLDWYYKNDDTQPKVYFTLDLTCLLQEA